jgi:hypothetical protein
MSDINYGHMPPTFEKPEDWISHYPKSSSMAPPKKEEEEDKNPKPFTITNADWFYILSKIFNNPDKAPLDYVPNERLKDYLKNKAKDSQFLRRFDQPMPDFWDKTHETFFGENTNGVLDNWGCIEKEGLDPEEQYQKAIQKDMMIRNTINPLTRGYKMYDAYKKKQELDKKCGRK